MMGTLYRERWLGLKQSWNFIFEYFLALELEELAVSTLPDGPVME